MPNDDDDDDDVPIECIYVFWMDKSGNSCYFPLYHKAVSFYNRNGECLLRGTNWILQCNAGYSGF